MNSFYKSVKYLQQINIWITTVHSVLSSTAKGSRNIRKNAEVVTMSLEGGLPPASASDSLGVWS